VRTAVLGAYELSSPSRSPPVNSLRSHGFKAPKVRRTPNSVEGKRAKLVDFDSKRVVENENERKALKQKRSIARTTGKREFSTSARQERASEESLEYDDGWLDGEGGDWDASTGANRMKMPKPGDWIETRR
jgi:hypothetical protein